MSVSWIPISGQVFAERADVWIQIHRVICERFLLRSRNVTHISNGGPGWSSSSGFFGENLTGQVISISVPGMISAMSSNLEALMVYNVDGLQSVPPSSVGNYTNSNWTEYTGPGSTADGGINNDNRDPLSRADWSWFVLRFREILESLTHVEWLYIRLTRNVHSEVEQYQMSGLYPFEYPEWGTLTDADYTTSTVNAGISVFGLHNYLQLRTKEGFNYFFFHGFGRGASLDDFRIFFSAEYRKFIDEDFVSGPDTTFWIRAEQMSAVGPTPPASDLDPPELEQVLQEWSGVTDSLAEQTLEMTIDLEDDRSAMGFQLRKFVTDGPTIDSAPVPETYGPESDRIILSSHSEFEPITFYELPILRLRYTKTDLSDDDIPPI
jgi:hypothetical protein